MLDSYYQDLKKLIKIPIEETGNDSHHSYFTRASNNPRITIGTRDCSKQKLFVVLTHEYGHYLSWSRNDLTDYDEAMIKSKNLRNCQCLTMWQLCLIRNEEWCAWTFGENFVKRRGFKLNKEFYQIKNNSLKLYSELVYR